MTDPTAPLSNKNNKLLQKITDQFLCYAWAVDLTMLVTLSALVLMSMILRVHSDTSYLSEVKAHSCAGGLYYMGTADIDNATLNSAVLTSMSIMKPVLSSASEDEIGMLFDNCKKATILQTTLHKMGTTLIQVDNSTTCRITNNSIKQQ
jgi:hypothetical protein